jgi:hypothetical protein
MMRRGLIYLWAALTSFFVISCRSNIQSLNKTWFFAFYTSSGENVLPNPPLNPENFIDLQKDGNYTSYISGFDYGTWKKEVNGIQLVNQKGDKKFLKVISLEDGEMTLHLSAILKDGPHHVFTGIPNTNINEANNPFSKQNNRWRIRPSAPETSEQIKDRLVNHFRFWEKYFEWAVANDLKTLGIGSMNSPLKIYGNGIALIPYNELPDVWKRNFFDEGDSQIAWDKLKKMMDTKNVAWPKTDNRFKFFISGFQQLQGMVE